MSRDQRDVFVELLVIQAQAGDAQAIGSLATLFHQELVSYSFRLVAESHAANDVAQEAWVIVMGDIGRLKDPASFRAWLFRIVHNKSMNRLRKTVRDRSGLSNFQQSKMSSANVAMTEPQIEYEDVRKLIDVLPPSDRALLTLYYENNLSIREIAAITGHSVSATKSRLHYVRQTIKQQLPHPKRSKHDD